MLRILGLTICTMVLWLFPLARAQADEQTPQQRAAGLHAEGRDHYSAGDYDDAVVAFEQAYRISQLPGILFNIAQAHRLRGDCREATRHYRRYIEASPASSNRPAAKAHIEDLKACAREDGEGATAGGDGEATTARARQDQDREPNEGAEPLAPAPDLGVARDSSSGGAHMRTIGIGVGVAGLVAVGTGALTGVSARSKSSDLDAYLEDGGEFDEVAQGLETSFNRRRGWSIGLVAGGAAVTVAGGALYMLARNGDGGTERDPSLSIAPQDGGAVMLFSGRY